ncbi:STT3 domain-containing protein [Halolamina salifodinae]|uniref:dolichyl-phosphooligosaccharide-protein glycotransferase n=1 Tax=Halolamina salifodinae TaxID=1202767 RepID=A0A8T4GXT0_9EURY|nr:STT3 domain-containing protein [Halolamina salifodinae]MBP1987789.1 dolichyl-diphosphooligosaccharide--protein glycosyltransferase [Halolamina salifodinae]
MENVDGEYRLADPDATRAALEGEEPATAAASSLSFEVDFDLPPRRVTLALLGAFALVAAFRLFAYPSVFRGEHVVFLGNDPYYYRYLLLESLEQGATVTSLPDSVLLGEPLLTATLLAVTKLFGGTVETADLVLAWYPVVAGLVTAGLVYMLTVKLTEERRVGLAAVVVLAVTPVHAYRTAVGFADHHAFDYVWLAVTAVAAVTLLQRTDDLGGRWLRDPWLLGSGAVVAVGVAAQVLAWNAGPILLLPLALYGVLRVTAAVDAGESALPDLLLATGIGLGGGLAVGVHSALGWQELYIVATPLLLAAGLVSVVLVGEVAQRQGVSARVTAGGVAVAGAAVFAIAYVAVPGFATEFSQEINRLFIGSSVEGVAESASLFGTQYGTVTGPFFFFGLSLFFALPYLGWCLVVGWTRNRPVWQLLGSYGGALFVLSLLEVRFAGQLALFAAVFGGIALVHLISVTGAAARPVILSENESVRPWRTQEREESDFSLTDRETAISIVLIFLLVGGLGAVMTPARTSLLTVNDDSYEAASFMAEYSAEEGWEYPQNYVFSEWGDSRMYNAIVNGESRGYGYAQSNYEDFLASTNASAWYQRIDGRVGFIVVEQYSELETGAESAIYNRLQNWGKETGHYRAIWASEDGSIKVFTPVPGATVSGSAEPNSTFTTTTTVNVAGQGVTYSRTVTVNESGRYSTLVPYPGTYVFAGEEVTVSEEAVRSGGNVRAGNGSSSSSP